MRATVITALLAAAGATPAQSIQITSMPAYGAAGSIAGAVTGVNYQTHSVAVYIHVEGSGWWSKPSSGNPTVPIQSNGAFVANVVGGGLDAIATMYCVALLPPGVTAPPALGSCRVPINLQAVATDCAERFGRTVQFAGRTWAVKDAWLPVGPGGNLFSSDPGDVWVDAQGLHLRVQKRGTQWWCTEVILLDDVGYGTYWFTTESQVGTLDANLTLGAFTWDAHCDDTATPGNTNREIDFEDSRWGNANNLTSSQVVVQPWNVPGNTIRYTTPLLTPSPTLTRFLSWSPSEIEFVSATGRRSPCRVPAGSVLHQSTYLHAPARQHYVPPSGREAFRFNLWINTGGAPSNGQTAEVVISDFRFSPIRGVFAAGCGVNPAGSLPVLSGAPVVGGTIVLGIDNPAGTQTPGSSAVLILSAQGDLAFPCGTVLPQFGMTNAGGEILIELTSPVMVSGGVWSGPGQPAPVPVAIPNDPSLIGRGVYLQGAILDAAVGALRPVGLTDAVELCVQP